MSNSIMGILRSVAISVLVAGNMGWAQSTIQPRDRLREAIAENEMVTLVGNVHPAVAHAVSSVPVDASFPMEHMILLLQPDSAQTTALDQLLAQQQDPRSSQYHNFLTPGQFAARFGASQNDINRITGWLSQHGFKVEEVTANHLSIIFSGDVYAVQSAFKTEVKQYSVNGEVHHANSSEPQIPAALAGVVKGVVKMHDFHARPFSSGLRAVRQTSQPLSTASSTTHYLVPADFATIYDIRPLYLGGLNGATQSVAIVGRSNVKLNDITAFRTQFGLPLSAGSPTVIFAQDNDPGFTGNGDAVEATLDVEWAGAIAPQAQIKLVVAASTTAADGVDLAALYAVNHAVAPVLSVSFGSCESDMASSSSTAGGTELAFYNSLWQQAAAQGISVFVSAGDSGAAGCDSDSATSGTKRAVNGICSSPYATCVGGTEFYEGNNANLYWLPGSNFALGTAQSYIPEVAWNESGANGGSGLAAGGGGASMQWPKPNWQVGTGVPNDNYRDVPDVSLTAASHDGYLIFFDGALSSVGGTSLSAPSMAGLFAIVNQKYNSKQGNANPVLYPLAIKQTQGGGAVFHDITHGNNTVPGVEGYAAGVGYDLASGLGSVDALQLVNHWRDVSPNGSFTLTAAPTTLNVQAGQIATVSATVAVNNGFNWPVTFSVSGAPSGVTALLSPVSLGLPGSGISSLRFAAALGVASGAYTVTVRATGGAVSKTASLVLMVTAIEPKCSLALSPATLSMAVGQASNVKLTCTAPQGNLPASLALAVSGQPSGVTTSFSPSTIVPGTGVSALTVIAGSSAAAGSYTLAVTASSGTFSQTINLPVTLATPPTFAVTLTSSAVSTPQAVTGQVQVTVTHKGSFNSSVALAVSGLPAGMTPNFSPAQFAAPGDGTSTLTLLPSLAVPPGKYTIAIVASGGAPATGGVLVLSTPLVVTVTAAPSFTLAVDQPTPIVYAAKSAAVVNLAVKNLTGNFNSAVTLSATGLPAGVTAVFQPATLNAPGSGTSALSLTALDTVIPGQYRVALSAAGGTVTQTVNLYITAVGLPGFTLKSITTSLAMTAGASFSTQLSIVPQNGFNSPVTLAIGALPAGLTGALSAATIGVNGAAILTIQTAATLAPGSYSISVSGTSSVIANVQASQTATIKLTMGSVQTALGATSLTAKSGAPGSVSVTTTATNYTGTVSFSVSELPIGVSFVFTPNALAGSGTTSLTISLSQNAQRGTYAITVRTTAGGTVSTTPLTLILI